MRLRRSLRCLLVASLRLLSRPIPTARSCSTARRCTGGEASGKRHEASARAADQCRSLCALFAPLCTQITPFAPLARCLHWRRTWSRGRGSGACLHAQQGVVPLEVCSRVHARGARGPLGPPRQDKKRQGAGCPRLTLKKGHRAFKRRLYSFAKLHTHAVHSSHCKT